jgi:glycosyltransferase involved in cell wall biosynthesis
MVPAISQGTSMSEDKVSVIIPSRNEQFLIPTVRDLFAKAAGPIEIIVTLDGGPWPTGPRLESCMELGDLTIIRHPVSYGTRASINDAVAAATGEFIMKSDAHCLYAEGFDETLKGSCRPDYVVVPRRRRLDAENWRVEETDRPDIDYEYMSWHATDFGGRGHNILKWEEKNRDQSLRAVTIDDTMCFQASCYFMHRSYFHDLELMDQSTYGKTQNEGEEICFKAWLSGGRVIVNKLTYYAHLYKGSRYPRDYKFERDDLNQGASAVRRWLSDSAWDKQTLSFAWLIDKFNPPGWPPDWAERVKVL